MNASIQEFFVWLIEHSDTYSFDHTPFPEQDLDVFLERLQAIDPDLWFEIGGDRLNGCTEIIISANGNVAKFELVKSIVLQAPVIPAWRFIALKPPASGGFVTQFEGLTLDPAKIRFQLLESQKTPGLFAIQVEWPSFEADEDRILGGLYIAVDALLGEERCARFIKKIWCAQSLPNGEDALLYLSTSCQSC